MPYSLNLRPISSAEFSDYEIYFIEDYSKEITENYPYSKQKAIAIAQEDLEKSFPERISMTPNELMCIDITSDQCVNTCGYLWYSHTSNDKKAFICDFYIINNYRSNGYGQQAMHTLEELLASKGVQHITLRVAYQNEQARRLYQKIGFNITGYNMIKKIKN